MLLQMDPDGNDLFEQLVAEDRVVKINELCPSCTAFLKGSPLVKKFMQGRDIRVGAEETASICSPERLKAGYLHGCHLCALVWARAGGRLLDPEKPAILATEVAVKIRARNIDEEYRRDTQLSSTQRHLWKLNPPSIGERGLLYLTLPAVRDYEARFADISGNFKFSQLYIYPASYPDLNQATMSHQYVSVSSKDKFCFPQIEAWFRDCCTTHARCREFQNLVAPEGQLPSRLLDLRGDKIRLECSVQDIVDFQYTTLSHMWGPDPSTYPQLKQDSLNAFQKEIPSSRLPAKYLDAIRVTKALGFHYLWIDSLCIIQDSPEDWETEALKMAAVYGRTACNISYTHPPSEAATKLHLRDPRIHLPCKLSPEILESDDERSFLTKLVSGGPNTPTSLIVQHVAGAMTEFWSPNSRKGVWPLLTRAWVFQERLLCPRNVYYGHGRLLWECCEAVRDEFCGQLKHSPRSKERFHAIFSGSEETGWHKYFVGALKGQWHLLVQDYRALDLTFEKDRIIAFAGIARAIQTRTKFTYLAGIWKELAEFDLLWTTTQQKRQPENKQLQDEKARQLARVPSWSWFSVYTSSTGPHGIQTVDFTVHHTMYGRSSAAIYQAKVISHDHPGLSDDPDRLLYHFEDLSITLRTHRIDCTLKWDGNAIHLLPRGKYVATSEYWLEPKNAMKYAHDDVAVRPGSELPPNACMVLTLLEAWHVARAAERKYGLPRPPGSEDDPTAGTHWQYAGLVVAPSGRRIHGLGTWRRIGVFLFGDKEDGDVDFTTPFNLDDGEVEILLV